MENFRKDITVILSAGHGGIDPSTGTYNCLAKGKEHTFSDGVTVHEGMLNRIYSGALALKLLALGYKVKEIHHAYLDYSLQERADRAQGVSGECCLIPIHHNASVGHNAKGAEIFTTRGKTEADTLADMIWMKLMMVKRLGYDLKMRSDPTDGDHDKEANFYEIRKFDEYHRDRPTTGAHAYLELEFFDYEETRTLLFDPRYIDVICEQVAQGIDLYYRQLKTNKNS